MMFKIITLDLTRIYNSSIMNTGHEINLTAILDLVVSVRSDQLNTLKP